MPFELNPPPPDQGLGWFQAGAAIGARNADRALQAQELRSKEAERIVRERNLAAELQHIQLQNQQLNVSIQKRAADEAEYGNAMHSADAAYKIAEASSDPEQTSLPSPQDFRDRAALQIADNPMAEQHLKTVGEFEQRKALAAWEARRQSSTGIDRQAQLIADIEKWKDNPEIVAALTADLKRNQIQQQQRGTQLEQNAAGIQLRGVNTDLRRTGLVQGAVAKEGQLAEQGLKPTISLMPGQSPAQSPVGTSGPVVPAPRGAALGEPLVQPEVRPLTPSNATKNQEALSTATSALRQADKLLPLINSGTFGPMAKIGNIVIDKGLANIYPDLLNEDRVTANTVAAGLNAATVKALRSDGNITETERESIIADVPSPKKMLTSPKEAVIQLRTINQGIVDRAIQASRNLKQPISDELVDHIPKDQIEPLIREHLLSTDQAKLWYQLHKRK